MPWSWINTEYSIHQIQHHPKIHSLLLQASFPLAASFPSLGGCSCTQLSTYPQLEVNQWIESQLPSRLPPNRPLPSTPPISLNHRLQVHLQTYPITASQRISEFMITALKCIYKLALLQPPSSYHHGLQFHLQTRLITASKSISKLAQLRPQIASPNSLDHGLKVQLQPHLITASKSHIPTIPGNPPAVWVLTCGLVWFGSRPSQKPDPLCLGGVVPWTGYKPAVVWPGCTQTGVPYYGYCNFGSK